MSTPESELDAAEAKAEQRYADYWGGTGPAWLAGQLATEAHGMWPDGPQAELEAEQPEANL